MIRRYSAAIAVPLTVVFVWLAPVLVAGQGVPAEPKKWSMPHTRWGDPDLQGIWSNFNRTPFELPNPDAAVALAERAVLERRYAGTGAGASQLAELGVKTEAPTGGAAAAPPDYDSPTSPRRPSLVVDPPNGRVPVIPPETGYLKNYDLYEDSWEHHTPFERCITKGVPGIMFPYGYNNGYQIVQSPGYVVIIAEMIHEARIIPVDGRPHLGKSIRQWDGDPRGHWEGNTLVVDTTNYNGKGNLNSTGRVVNWPQTETLHVVERFTRVDAKTINYEVTIDDPKVFTRPWKVALPINWDPTYQMYEYGCHEGNVDYMEGSLRAGRVREKAAADAAKKN